MTERVLVLPYGDLENSNEKPILPAPFSTILKTMESWCSKYLEKGNINGLVVFGYTLDDHLKFLKYPANIIEKYLYNKTDVDNNKFQETITVYNPQKRVIFLIRRAKDKDNLQNEMKSSIDDILKFVFLYNDILKNSGVKLINLLVTDAKVACFGLQCEFCKHQVISMDSLDSGESFQKWLEEKECNFATDYKPRKNENFSFDFSSKLLGFLASFQFYKRNHFYEMLPSLTDDSTKQMEEATILLTLEQLQIVHSPNKHIMMQGCYGSGKSIIARKKAEIVSKMLNPNELLYFISYDSSSMLTVDIKITTGIKLYRNTEALKLSDIINKLKKKHPEQKINLFVDEYDAEQLDEPEATALNHTFTIDEMFCDSIVFIIFEALERERMVNGRKRIANLLPRLKSMELKELTYNKRNTLQIHKLVEVTTDVLKKETTTAFFPIYKAQDSKIQLVVGKALEEKQKSEAPGQASMMRQPRKEKDVQSNEGKKNIKNKKIIFDEACKYFRSPINRSMVGSEVATTFRHRESKHSGHSIESAKPNLYEVSHFRESERFILSLIVTLEQIIFNDYKDIEKHVILHFDVEKDIPSNFYTAFKMMDIFEKVTTKYEEFQKDNSKKIFLSGFRAFRGLEYPRVVVVLDKNVVGLEQYLPECLSRCTAYLHAIVIQDDTHFLKHKQHNTATLHKIISTWKDECNGETLMQRWMVRASHENEVSSKFYERLDSGIIMIYSNSNRYKKLTTKFFHKEDTNEETNIQEEIASALARSENILMIDFREFALRLTLFYRIVFQSKVKTEYDLISIILTLKRLGGQFDPLTLRFSEDLFFTERVKLCFLRLLILT